MFDIKSFYEARDVKDAVEALVREPEAEIISGGTDVLIRVREGKDAGRALVSIHNIKELKGVKVLENGDLWIGAATAFSHITNDPTIQKLVPMLGEAVDMVGGPQIRNTGTIGGNICNGATSADSAASMWTLNALIQLEGPEGHREVPIHEFYTGPVGMHGTKTSNYAMCECDLLITLGARFSDRVTGDTKTFAPKAKILQIDVDAAEINKNIVVDASVIGDLREVLKLLLEKIPEKKHEEWAAHIQDMKEKYPLNYDHSQLTGPYVIQKLYELTGGDAIISTDVGQHQMWAAQYYKYRQPRTLLTSGGLGTMGYGLGASIGAKMGCKDKTVINIAGDGCFRMNMNKIATAAREKLPLIEVIVNNHVLGMVRQWQDLFYEKRYSATVLDDGVDFVKLAEAMGAKGYRVTSQEEFKEAFKEALESEVPVLIDCIINCDDKVWPMVAPGEAISSSFTGEDLAKKQQS